MFPYRQSAAFARDCANSFWRAKDARMDAEDWNRAREATLNLMAASTWAPSYAFTVDQMCEAIFQVLRATRRPQTY